MPGPRWLSGDASLGRWFGTDPQNQFASPYVAMGNNPVMFTDPNGEFVTWSIGKGGLSIGFNLTPIRITLGAGLNIGWGNGGPLDAYGEVGYRFGGTGLGSGATVSQSLDYGFRSGFSTTTSAGTYASFGLFNAGANGSYTYDLKSRQGSFGWGISGGINLGGNDAWGMGLTIGYGSDGFNYGVGGYFNPKAIKTTLIKEYNLDGASPNALQQRDGYDCLICAVE